MIVLIYRFNRAEIGCYGQSYSGRVDIHGLIELNSGYGQSYSDRVDIQVLFKIGCYGQS